MMVSIRTNRPLKIGEVHFVASQVLDEVLPELRELLRRQLLGQVERLAAVVLVRDALPEVSSTVSSK